MTYSEEDYAWRSEKITLQANIVLRVEFKPYEHGKVIIQKQNEPDGPAPKIFISQETQAVRLTLHAEAAGKIIQIFTSEQPQNVSYINL